MNKKKFGIIVLVFFLLIALGLYSAYKYLNPATSAPLPTDGKMVTIHKTSPPTVVKEVPYKVDTVATNLFVPWSIIFTSKERMLFSERNGKIREIVNGKLNPTALATFSEVSQKSEEGLMSLVLDPDYKTNKYLYAAIAYQKGNQMAVKIERLIDENISIKKDKIIIDHIPAAQYHAGTRLRFGPDKKLYITTGEATQKQIAQDLNSLGGKILRINSDGSFPADNPFPNSPIFSYGHRNPQGIDWYPGTSVLYETEHGPSTFDGPPGGDEVNIIEKGQNYGWPLVSHARTKEGTVAPKIIFTPAIAPASGMFYTGDIFPQFKNNFFFGGLKGEAILRAVIDPKDPKNILSYGKLNDINVGRVRDIAQGPDGYLYFSTSNRDGRGTVHEGDDKIYRLIPSR